MIPVHIENALPPPPKHGGIIRWLCIFPAAWLASVAVQFVVGTAVHALFSAHSTSLHPASIGLWGRVVPAYVLPQLAFVITGGLLAPRRQPSVAIWLMLIGSLLSLQKHVIGQMLIGNLVGVTNYTHCGLELVGLLSGVLYVQWKSPDTRCIETST